MQRSTTGQLRPYWPAPPLAKRIPGLDGVRAIAILLVLVAHLGDPSQVYTVNRAQLGLFGVEIFFVLSGFLITTLLLDEEMGQGRISIRLFYLRRAFRIFPAAYAFIAVMFVLSIAGLIPLTGRDLAHAATYTTNYYSWEVRSWQLGHLWSLAVEEQFYLLWPMALCALGKRGRFVLLGIVIIACPAIRNLYETSLPALRHLVTESFETTADALAFGCLLAFARPYLHGIRYYKRLISLPWVPVALGGAAFVLSQSARLIDMLGPMQYSAIYLVVALLLDSVISQPGRSVVGWALNSRLMVFLGGVSYSLYLWQQPFMNPHSSAWWIGGMPGIVLALVAALLSYYLLEKPLMGVRRRFEHRAVQAAEAGPAVAGSTGNSGR